MYTAIIELVRKFLPQILAAVAFIVVLSILPEAGFPLPEFHGPDVGVHVDQYSTPLK